MNVVTILKQKGNQVTTITAASTLLEAAHKLAAKKIGAVVVADGDGRVKGILSERDIVRAISQGGAGVLSAPVSDVMTRDVITCTEADTLDELRRRFTVERLEGPELLKKLERPGFFSGSQARAVTVPEATPEAPPVPRKSPTSPSSP